MAPSSCQNIKHNLKKNLTIQHFISFVLIHLSPLSLSWFLSSVQNANKAVSAIFDLKGVEEMYTEKPCITFYDPVCYSPYTGNKKIKMETQLVIITCIVYPKRSRLNFAARWD